MLYYVPHGAHAPDHLILSDVVSLSGIKLTKRAVLTFLEYWLGFLAWDTEIKVSSKENVLNMSPMVNISS
jgi:hypothetical protein